MNAMKVWLDWSGQSNACNSLVNAELDYYAVKLKVCKDGSKKVKILCSGTDYYYLQMDKSILKQVDMLIQKTAFDRFGEVVALTGYNAFEEETLLTADDLDGQGWLYVTTENKCIHKEDATDLDRYAQCEHCHRYFPTTPEIDYLRGYGVHTEDDHYFCNECIDDDNVAFRCEDCGEWYSIDHYMQAWDGLDIFNSSGNTIHVCQHCKDVHEWTICEDCGCAFRDGEGGDGLCADCANERAAEQYDDDGNMRVLADEVEQAKAIHKYHFAGDYTDYGMHYLGSAERYQKPLLGIELEIDVGGTNDENAVLFRNILGEENCVICKDGSLRKGMEIVSCPANYENHKELKWKEFVEKALALGYRSHDPGTCGLHIHIDREFFKDSDLDKDDIEGAFFIILRNNLEWLKPFSRRKTWHYCVINGQEDHEDVSENKIGRILSMKKYVEVWDGKAKKNRRDRYQAINFSRPDTIEFRLFRGTLKYSTFMASLQLVDMFARTVKDMFMLEQAMRIDLDYFVDLAYEMKYHEFLNYLNDLGLTDASGY